jgi:hypothetical protein
MLALCGSAQAATPPSIDLTATPAWKGWSRPGRATEVDIRLSTDAATPATVEVAAGRHTVRTALELQPGRSVRLQLPVSSIEGVSVSASVPGGTVVKRDVDIAQSESPLLGSGIASGNSFQLEGFHTVALTADDLPRNPLAYSSIDALILDAPTLGALDQRQLAALLAHIAACGRLVLLNTDARIGQLLDSAGGCSGHSLSSAATLADAKVMLKSSLSTRLPKPMPLADIDGSAGPAHPVLNRVAVALALYFAATVLVLMFTTHPAVLLLMPALSALAVLAMLHAMQPPARLVIWSEGSSGAPLARYQAWQQFAGVLRERMRAPIPPQLAADAMPCNPSPALHIDFDLSRARPTFAEFETRLFRQVSLCYSGGFPLSRAVSIETRDEGVRIVRNSGARGWPEGALVLGGLVHELPALGPGATATLMAKSGQAPGNATHRNAIMRTPIDGASALWKLELAGVADIPVDSKGWLLVSIPTP